MTRHSRLRTAAMVCALAGAAALSPARVSAQGATPASAQPCLACHPGSANTDAQMLANLAGLSSDYILKQLRDYRAGRRKSPIMTPMAERMNKSDLRIVAAHFAALTPRRGTVTDAALAARGKAVYENGNPSTGVPNCVGCHGPNGGNSPRYPSLAGEVASYTAREMHAFKDGTRMNDRARVMRLIASRMSDAEIDAIAEYLAGLTR